MSFRLDPFDRYTQPMSSPALDLAPRPQWQTQATPASSQTATPAANPPAQPATQPPNTPADLLNAGSSLKTGQEVRSANGQYALAMQDDGNLVLRDLANNKVLWASNTAGRGAQSATMQPDGNLVVFGGTSSATATTSLDSLEIIHH